MRASPCFVVVVVVVVVRACGARRDGEGRGKHTNKCKACTGLVCGGQCISRAWRLLTRVWVRRRRVVREGTV